MSSVAKRPNGRWRARYRDADGVEHARHFLTRAAARRWLDETTADRLTGRYVHPRAGRITLADYYARFAARQLWQPTTRRAVDHALATCPLGGTELSRLTRADVESWAKAMADAGLAASTVRARVAALRAVLAGAVRDRLIVDNPCAGVRLPRVAARTREAVLPTPEDVERLIAVAERRLAVAIALAAHAGLRLGEIRGLQVGDLDLLAGRLTVRRQVRATAGGGWEATAPKYGSVRTITLPAHLTDRLRRATSSRSPGAWVVGGRDGRPVHPTTLARRWSAAKAAAGLHPGLRLHDLRHFYASFLLAQGVDVLRVQRALGHARASTTLDVYGHVLDHRGHVTDERDPEMVPSFVSGDATGGLQ
ncbi:tyrosine-type recombinase/integrase [Georgenia sp. AZ-5]|uniref:tyrosine-type recombinase/integrase n=1 Tax=Georgenia sp. AZ-5 TaxID=3367526 RepID=UPI003754C8C2